MADLGRAPAGRPMTLLWMVLALVVVGGFLTWLAVASEPTTVLVLEDNDMNGDPDELGNGAITVVDRDTLAVNMSRYAGQQLQVRGVAATGRLGPGLFWGELGDQERQVPILVRMEPAAAEAIQIQQGVAYSIVGVLDRVSDALVNTWAEQGEFAGEGEQLQATFADYYIAATVVRPTRGGRAEPGS
jgi:hypothetical protein